MKKVLNIEGLTVEKLSQNEKLLIEGGEYSVFIDEGEAVCGIYSGLEIDFDDELCFPQELPLGEGHRLNLMARWITYDVFNLKPKPINFPDVTTLEVEGSVVLK